MGMLDIIKRGLLGFIGIVIGLILVVLAARGDELSGPGVGARGVVVHDAAETLERFCVPDTDGTWWFTPPGGARWELVTRIADPAIANPGDGVFHPFDADEVRAAIAALRYPLGGLGIEVFVLPYPRRAQLESAAGPGLILLSPGVMPVARETQHVIVTHELGHVVHLARMPDAGAEAWSRWRSLRGVSDEGVYRASAMHADRPHEIFAEDFRVLFGDALAASGGSIENAALTSPAAVPGLDAFVLSLVPVAPGPSLVARPNPSRAAVTMSRVGDVARMMDVYDVTGRRVATLAPEGSSAGWNWRWDGRGDDGRTLAPGRYLARERGSATEPARITRMR